MKNHLNTTRQNDQATDPNSIPSTCGWDRILLPLLIICFWLGNLLIAAPTIATKLADKAAPMVGGMKTEWLTACIAVLIATSLIVVTLAARRLDGAERRLEKEGASLITLNILSRPSIIALLGLGLFYTSLYQHDREKMADDESREFLPMPWPTPDSIPFGLLWMMAAFVLHFPSRHPLNQKEFVTIEAGVPQ